MYIYTYSRVNTYIHTHILYMCLIPSCSLLNVCFYTNTSHSTMDGTITQYFDYKGRASLTCELLAV